MPKTQKDDSLLDPTVKGDETTADRALRPKTLGEFIGQESLKANLTVFIKAAKQRGEPLDHCLFYAPPGLGKTTLANILAREMGVNLRTASGPILARAGDLAALLTDISEGDVFFIDEIHRLNAVVEEALYPVMEDYTFFISTGKGPAASTLKLAVPRFTLVGATTRSGLLTGPLRDRFGIVAQLGDGMPPVRDFALLELVSRMQQYLPPGLFRLARQKNLTVLQLIAEPISAALLVIGSARPNSSGNGLVF